MDIQADIAEGWDLEIKPQDSVFNLHLKDTWAYRDLLWLLVRRDFVSFYKQTIFGPLWFFIQPIFTTLIFTFIFSSKFGIKGIPPTLFFMAGTIAWNYFADCLTKVSTVFRDNVSVFGKVYFPRLIMPISIVISNLVKFGVQFLLFIVVLAYYLIKRDPLYNINFNLYIILFPIIIFLMALVGLGLGLIVTALTTKYRDLVFVVQFGVQLAMYATPVIYSLSDPQIQKHLHLYMLNPLSALIETFRYGFLGAGKFYPKAFAYSVVTSIVIFLFGLIIFNRVERNFVDTV